MLTVQIYFSFIVQSRAFMHSLDRQWEIKEVHACMYVYIYVLIIHIVIYVSIDRSA